MTDAPDILETAQKALELSAKACHAPWDRVDAPNHPGFGEFAGQVMVYANKSPLCGYRGPPMTPEDCDLIAFSRNNLEALALEVIRLRGEVEAEREQTVTARTLAFHWMQKAQAELTALREVANAARGDFKSPATERALAALDSLRGGTEE